MVEEWRLVELEHQNPYLNMALEEAIPTMVGGGLAPETLRFWRNTSAVVIGRFQCVELEVNLEACKRYGVSVVRRFTGGGAVYHDLGNLNYAISLRKDNRLLQDDLLENFKTLSLGVTEGLRHLGLTSELGRNSLISVKGKKVSGVAASSSGKVFFQHGTLLVNTDLRILSEVLNSPRVEATEKGVRSTKSAVTSLRDELGRNIPLSQVKRALIAGFQEAHSVKLIPEGLTSEEKELAKRLYEMKYSREKWNFEL